MLVQDLEIGQEVGYKVWTNSGTETTYRTAKVTQIVNGLGIYVMVIQGKGWMVGQEFLVTNEDIAELISRQ